MDTNEEEFALMRESFLRAALEEAEAAGGPSSWVHLRRVAETLGADLSGEAGGAHATLCRDGEPLPGHGGPERHRHLGGEAVFRLTAQGIAEAKGKG